MIVYSKDLPVTGMSLSYVVGEIFELIEAIVNLDWSEVVGEFLDVYSCSMCVLETYFGINVPIVRNRSTIGWLRRQEIWREYLRRMGLKYDKKYLVNGGNYKKEYKRRLVVELAIKDQLGKEI